MYVDFYRSIFNIQQQVFSNLTSERFHSMNRSFSNDDAILNSFLIIDVTIHVLKIPVTKWKSDVSIYFYLCWVIITVLRRGCNSMTKVGPHIFGTGMLFSKTTRILHVYERKQSSPLIRIVNVTSESNFVNVKYFWLRKLSKLQDILILLMLT